jgi:hypothetical protein
MAALIATGSATGTPGGTPLLHGLVNRLNATSGGIGTLAVAANTTIFPFVGGITKPGYIISINPVIAAAGTTRPFLGVQMIWKDTVTGLGTAKETWYVPATAGGVEIYGKGPTKGGQLSIGLQNFDPANPMTVSMAFWETTHHVPRDDWRSGNANGIVIAGAVAANADPFAGLLINNSGTLGPNSGVGFSMPLYAGKASFTIFLAQAGSVEFNALTPLGFGGYAGNNLGLIQTAGSTSSSFSTEQDMGRWPIVVQLSNNTAVNSPYSITGAILEYAS